MHQQRLQRVADARARYLAVEQQPQREIQVGAGIDEQVADAFVVLDHRHARVLGDETDQALATARDGEVDEVGELQQLDHRLAAQVLDQGQRGIGQACFAQRALQRGGDGGIRMDRLAAAAQDHAVAGLQAQGRGIGRDVGARLVDHRDHAQRHAHALDDDAVGARLAARDQAHRVRQIRDFTQSVGDVAETLRIELQAVEHRGGDAFLLRREHVLRVGGEDVVGIALQCVRHPPQQRVLCGRRQLRDGLCGVAAGAGLGSDVGHGALDLTWNFSSTLKATQDHRGG